MEQQMKIEQEDITPTSTEEIKTETIFMDSNFPINATYLGTSSKMTSTGKEMPIYVFENGHTKYVLSKWNKLVIFPLPIKVNDKVTIYKNESGKLEILRLN
jgi:hypothetical protein